MAVFEIIYGIFFRKINLIYFYLLYHVNRWGNLKNKA